MPTSSLRAPTRVAILGVGLLGGSVGLALRRKLPDVQLVGTSRNPDRRQAAVDRGAVDEATDSIELACRDADVIVAAGPVDRIAAMVCQAARLSPDDSLITDVGSTKSRIVAAIDDDERARQKFVAAHPIAGSEKSGVQHARGNLFDGRVVVVTPAGNTPSGQIDRADHFWSLTGARVIRMTAEQHDAHLAAVSHVPHLVSALVARLAPPAARPLVGSGWRDITRVAAGDPAIWTAIVSENRTAIASELERLDEQIDGLRALISNGDDQRLFEWLAEAKRIKTEDQ